MESNLIFSSSFLRYALCAMRFAFRSTFPARHRPPAESGEAGGPPNSNQSGTGKGFGTSIRRGSFAPGEL